MSEMRSYRVEERIKKIVVRSHTVRAHSEDEARAEAALIRGTVPETVHDDENIPEPPEYRTVDIAAEKRGIAEAADEEAQRQSRIRKAQADQKRGSFRTE